MGRRVGGKLWVLAVNERDAELEAKLTDESIYADPNRKDELTQMIRDQAAVKSTIEQLESEWLEASEELEQAT